jgi:hypothetical protein
VVEEHVPHATVERNKCAKKSPNQKLKFSSGPKQMVFSNSVEEELVTSETHETGVPASIKMASIVLWTKKKAEQVWVGYVWFHEETSR